MRKEMETASKGNGKSGTVEFYCSQMRKRG